jgi:hypothetical protein
MTSPLQVLYFIAITLAPPGTQHINVTGGSEVYDRVIDPDQVLLNNSIVPDNVSQAQTSLVKMSHHDWAPHAALFFDGSHEVQKNSGGYVYVVRPGAPNQKTYSFTFSK